MRHKPACNSVNPRTHWNVYQYCWRINCQCIESSQGIRILPYFCVSFIVSTISNLAENCRNLLSRLGSESLISFNLFSGSVPVLYRHCPARWIRSKVGSFDRPFLKETSWRVIRKILPSPIEWEPFNSRAPSRNCQLSTQWANAQ